MYRPSSIGTVLMWLLLFLYLSPFYILFIIALKTKEDFARTRFAPTLNLIWGNLPLAAGEMDAFRGMVNTTVITFGSIFILLVLSAMASYSLARRKGKLYKGVYVYFIAGLMIPFQLIMLPLYRLIKGMGLMQTHAAIILIYVGTTIPLAIVILSGFIKTIPIALDEAALIDGATPWYIFLHIIIPLIRAPLVTVMIICMVSFWNDLLTPMLFLGSKSQTLIVSLYNFKGSQYTTDWTMVFSGSIVAISPLLIVFLAAQKSFIKGMVTGAIKG